MTKKIRKKDDSRKGTTCDEKERRTQATVNGNRKSHNYDILPEEVEYDYMVWFW